MTDEIVVKETASPKVEDKPTKSFSINSILARVEKEKGRKEIQDEKSESGDEKDNEPDKKGEDDVPAVISKLELPMFPMSLPKGFPGLPRSGEAGLLPLGHLPAWYHWYASQQNLQHWQSSHRNSK